MNGQNVVKSTRSSVSAKVISGNTIHEDRRTTLVTETDVRCQNVFI